MRALLLSAVASVVCAVAGAAQEVDYAGSMQVSSGSYIFTSPTRTLSLVNGLAVTLGRIRFSTHVPLILQNSGGVTVVGGAMLPTGGTGSGAVSGRQQGRPVPLGRGTPRAGATSGTATTADSIVHDPGRYRMVLGDPFVAAGLELYRGAGSLRIVEVTAGVKVPVTDVESGVGTGFAWCRLPGNGQDGRVRDHGGGRVGNVARLVHVGRVELEAPGRSARALMAGAATGRP